MWSNWPRLTKFQIITEKILNMSRRLIHCYHLLNMIRFFSVSDHLYFVHMMFYISNGDKIDQFSRSMKNESTNPQVDDLIRPDFRDGLWTRDRRCWATFRWSRWLGTSCNRDKASSASPCWHSHFFRRPIFRRPNFRRPNFFVDKNYRRCRRHTLCRQQHRHIKLTKLNLIT